MCGGSKLFAIMCFFMSTLLLKSSCMTRKKKKQQHIIEHIIHRYISVLNITFAQQQSQFLKGYISCSQPQSLSLFLFQVTCKLSDNEQRNTCICTIFKKEEHCYTYRIGQHSQLAIIKLFPTPCQRIICSESDGSVSTSNTCIPACSTTAVMLLLSSNKQSRAPCMSCECAVKNKNLWNILSVCVIEEHQQNC